MRVCEEAGNVIGTDQCAGGFKRPYVPLATIFEYHIGARIIDYRRPTVRFSECADFLRRFRRGIRIRVRVPEILNRLLSGFMFT